MALLTVERNSPSPYESLDNDDVLSSSSYEGFVAKEHLAVSLSPRTWTSLSRNGVSLPIHTHLKQIMKLVRPCDSLKMAVELENSSSRKVRKYLIVVMSVENQDSEDSEETLILGTEQEDTVVRLCLVLPVWGDTQIKLDGDGGFSVHTGDQHRIFKPMSVQSMWTTLQTLYKSTEVARACNHYVGGLSHSCLGHYKGLMVEDWNILNEWNIMEDVVSTRSGSPMFTAGSSDDKQTFEAQLVNRLREIMLGVDLEEVSSKQLRLKLEEEMKMDLKAYREFLDQQMLVILGQLEKPSKICDYLYLGSEWNAANLEELKKLGIGYIVNVTREIDNFYPEVFTYFNVRLYDLPDSELMKHWDKTYQFIKTAKEKGSRILVHCKMGISRSAATVVAYKMKEYQLTLDDALAYVKSKRSCINPNDGFIQQLRAYEGILSARHNELWGKHAPNRLFPHQRTMSEPNIRNMSPNMEMDYPLSPTPRGAIILHAPVHVHQRPPAGGTFEFQLEPHKNQSDELWPEQAIRAEERIDPVQLNRAGKGLMLVSVAPNGGASTVDEHVESGSVIVATVPDVCNPAADPHVVIGTDKSVGTEGDLPGHVAGVGEEGGQEGALVQTKQISSVPERVKEIEERARGQLTMTDKVAQHSIFGSTNSLNEGSRSASPHPVEEGPLATFTAGSQSSKHTSVSPRLSSSSAGPLSPLQCNMPAFPGPGQPPMGPEPVEKIGDDLVNCLQGGGVKAKILQMEELAKDTVPVLRRKDSIASADKISGMAGLEKRAGPDVTPTPVVETKRPLSGGEERRKDEKEDKKDGQVIVREDEKKKVKEVVREEEKKKDAGKEDEKKEKEIVREEEKKKEKEIVKEEEKKKGKEVMKEEEKKKESVKEEPKKDERVISEEDQKEKFTDKKEEEKRDKDGDSEVNSVLALRKLFGDPEPKKPEPQQWQQLQLFAKVSPKSQEPARSTSPCPSLSTSATPSVKKELPAT
eukprot:Em0015g936a